MDVDWDGMWAFTVSPWELVLRGTLMYWLIFTLLRLGGRRDLGSFGAADVLLLVLIADAAQNAMTGGYESVAEGGVLVSTLVFWSVAIDRICYYFPVMERVFAPKRICLVKDGRLQHRGMRREHITEEELMAELRSQGVGALHNVSRAYMESNGAVSILLINHSRARQSK
jgi:uncharacterized membrane protein YcaP (DUF421 family)